MSNTTAYLALPRDISGSQGAKKSLEAGFDILDAHLKPSVVSANVGNVGSGEDNLQTVAIAAGRLKAGNVVRIVAWGVTANNAAAKTVKLYFGSLAILTKALTTNQAGTWRIVADVTITATDTQEYSAQLLQGGTTTLIEVTNGGHTQDDGAEITVKCTGTASADNDIVQHGMIVKID